MSRITVDKSLAKGTAKQRAILLANHIAEVNLGGKGLLTDTEFDSLTNSFKTDQDIKTYNRYRKVYDEVRTYLATLFQFRFTYACNVEKLEKLLFLRRSNYDVEDLVNNLLDLMPDKKIKAKAYKLIKGFDNHALMRLSKIDSEGYVDLTGEAKFLDSVIEETRKEARLDQIRLKTAIVVVKDYISETGLNVRVLTAAIKETENWAKSKKGFLANLSFSERAVKSNPALKGYAEKDAIENPYAEVEVDQELYKQWREDFF